MCNRTKGQAKLGVRHSWNTGKNEEKSALAQSPVTAGAPRSSGAARGQALTPEEACNCSFPAPDAVFLRVTLAVAPNVHTIAVLHPCESARRNALWVDELGSQSASHLTDTEVLTSRSGHRITGSIAVLRRRKRKRWRYHAAARGNGV